MKLKTASPRPKVTGSYIKKAWNGNNYHCSTLGVFWARFVEQSQRIPRNFGSFRVLNHDLGNISLEPFGFSWYIPSNHE